MKPSSVKSVQCHWAYTGDIGNKYISNCSTVCCEQCKHKGIIYVDKHKKNPIVRYVSGMLRCALLIYFKGP